MEFIRSRIETQLMSLTGLSLGQLDLEDHQRNALQGVSDEKEVLH